MNLTTWKKTTLKNYCAKHNPPKGEVDHVIDYIKAHPTERLTRASYLQIKVKAEAWTKRLNKKKSKNLKSSGSVELVHQEDNLSFVKLKDKVAYNWEGSQMGHCVASYWGNSGSIYSIRDEDCRPHVTMHVSSKQLRQIRCVANTAVASRYHSLVLKGLLKLKVTLTPNVLHQLNFMPVNSRTLSALKKCFTGIKVITLAKISYLSLNSNLKIIPEVTFTRANSKLLELLVDLALRTRTLSSDVEDGIRCLLEVGSELGHPQSQKLINFFELEKEVVDSLLTQHPDIKMDDYAIRDLFKQDPERVVKMLEKNRRRTKILQELLEFVLIFEAGSDTKNIEYLMSLKFPKKEVFAQRDLEFYQKYHPMLFPKIKKILVTN